MNTYLQEAFNQVCTNAKPAIGYYVSLMERSSYYGGPEEGGWWGNDVSIVAYQWFDTEEQARAAKEEVEKLAEQFQEDDRKEYGEHCQRQCDWLETRGLDSDWLPEPDGPSEYFVTMSEELPSESRGCRHYE